MTRAKSCWNEARKRLPYGFAGRTAEHLFRRAIEEQYALLAINCDDGVHRRINDSGQSSLAVTQRLLGLLALGDVYDAREHECAFVGMYGIQANLDGYFVAVLATTIEVAS